jgi:hypothetical protein
MGVGTHTCHHLYRLAVSQSAGSSGAGRLTAEARLGVPRSLWSAVAARVTAGETLRGLAREYGVSYECIRRIARATAHSVGH